MNYIVVKPKIMMISVIQGMARRVINLLMMEETQITTKMIDLVIMIVGALP
jgi:hypothetical protein